MNYLNKNFPNLIVNFLIYRVARSTYIDFLQYFDLMRANSRVPPSELYGVVHFTRFVSKLPAFVRSKATAEMPLLNEHRIIWMLSHFNQVCADMIDGEPASVAYKRGGKAYFARFDTAEKYMVMVKEAGQSERRG
jgi:hypothetical protein